MPAAAACLKVHLVWQPRTYSVILYLLEAFFAVTGSNLGPRHVRAREAFRLERDIHVGQEIKGDETSQSDAYKLTQNFAERHWCTFRGPPTLETDCPLRQ